MALRGARKTTCMHGQFKRSTRLLIKYLRPQWVSVLLLAVLLLSNIGLQLLNPQVIRSFIDTTQAGGPAQTLLVAALLFIGIALFQRVVAFGATYLAQNISWTATNTLRADLALHCLLLDMSFHKKYTPGELIERIDGDMNALTNFFSQFTVQVLGNALLILGIQLQVTDLQQATASSERVEELLRLRSAVREKARASLPDGPLSLELQDVSFSYAQKQPVLQNISLHLPAGKVLGVLGRTGSGKTTLARLLFRLYDPASGHISLNGVDLRDLAIADLRAHVGMVTQDVQLFRASIRANLTFFQQEIDDDRIAHVLANLGLQEWLQSLPRGLDTELAAGGQGLSAGEAQLLALARVFLKNPGLVILDEASARLDPATENLLEQAINHLLARRTGIIIAHRLKTVLRADDILILENGRIVEYGPRETLRNKRTSRFYALLQTGFEEVFT